MPPVSVTIFASDPGTYFLEDDGIAGNNFSQIRFPNGQVVAFEHPTDDLFFDPSVAGITLVVNLTDTLGTADFTTGDFADPLSTADFIQVRNLVTAAGVTLVANNAITEFGNDAAADIVASTLIMSATTGVGTAGNAIETQVGVIEAETSTGGINIGNFGTVAIGGLTLDVDGLDVLTSGNIKFSTFGSIVISDDSGPESIHGGTTSGNVTLTANGVDSDVLANVDQDSISAPGGNITVTAGRDIGFGLIGANFDNDVRASGNVTFNPGRDFLLDGFADVASDNFGNTTGGDVVVNAGRNVTLLAVAGTDAGIEASGTSGGNIVLNTGPGGTVTLNSGNGTAPFASLISQSGDIVVNADRMSIGTNGAISSVSGDVIIRPHSAGWGVDVGSATDSAFALELSDAELDRIFTSSLIVGSVTSGQLDVTSAISPLNALGLSLRSGADIAIASSVTVGGNLSLRAGDNVFQLPASAINLGGALSAFVDLVGDDENVGGFAALNGSIVAASITLTGDVDADTLNGTSGDDFLNGGAGNDALNGFAGLDTINGGNGNDTIFGFTGNDIINGQGDDDTIDGGDGFDTINGGDGNDTLHGGGDGTAETVHGNDGNDTITSTGEGSYFGDGGDDTIFAGVSSGVPDEILDGGDGIDTLDVTSDGGDYAINLATGTTNFAFESFVNFENLVTGDGADTLAGTSGANTIRSGDNKDTVTGGNGADTLIGEGGPDTLFGNAGSDTLFGGTGGDRLFGGVGKDTMTGNAANDQFTFLDGETAATRAGADIITDFNQTHKDLIKLKAMDANTTLAGDQKFLFIGAGAFTGTARELHFVQDGGNTFIEGDTDGDGLADFVIRLNGLHTLVGADFVL